VEELRIGGEPVTVGVAEGSGAIYVGDSRSGNIFVLDGESFEEIAELEADRGLSALALAPGGRWGVATNPGMGQVILFDTSSNLVTHVADIDGAPDQISFSQQMAYVRVREAAQIAAIPLDEIDPAAALPLNLVPVGTQAPGFFPSMSLANAVFPIPGQNAVVIANPADDQVYFYPEGATAASGSFQGHTLFPRAVHVVDRSLREEAPGVYAGRVRIPEEGQYLVAVMLTDPVMVHCFEFTAKPNEALEATVAAGLDLQMVDGMDDLVAGQPATLRFRLTEAEGGAPADGLTDVLVLASQTVGNWSTRQAAVWQEDGVYAINIVPPQAGLYALYFFVPSRQLDFGQFPTVNFQVGAGG